MRTKKRRVTVATPLIAPGGGPAGYTHNLLMGLAGTPTADFEFTFVGRRSEKRSRFSGVRRRGLFRRLVDRFVKATSSPAPAFVASCATSAIVVLQGFQHPHYARLAKMFGCHLIYMPHSPSPKAHEESMVDALLGKPQRRKLYAKLLVREKRLFALADTVVFPTVNATEEYRKSFGDDLLRRAAFIPSGVEGLSVAGGIDLFPVWGAATKILFAGRYVGHKGFDLYNEAAMALSDDSSIQFFSIGSGLMPVSAYVTDLGWTEEPAEYASQADVIVVPNRIAYFDLWPLEVASLGKPLVLTKVGGNIDQLISLPDAVGADQERLVDAILTSVDRVRADKTWGSANQRVFEQQFTREEMARRWVELLRKLHR